MSCNGCRVLRKGCSDNCVLRQCLQWINTPQAQAHATLFVAKFFGRAGLMSFISAVPEHQRPALFQSLLYEAVGRTVNPVNGAVGLLWTGNWHVCQTAVETVLRGGALGPPADSFGGAAAGDQSADTTASEHTTTDRFTTGRQQRSKSRPHNEDAEEPLSPDLDLCLVAKPRAATPSEESETTALRSCFLTDNLDSSLGGGTTTVLRLFL